MVEKKKKQINKFRNSMHAPENVTDSLVVCQAYVVKFLYYLRE